VRGDEARHVLEILDAEGDALERARLAAQDARLGGARSSGPAIADSISAASPTVRAIGPSTE
jgi:hypothetical protein